MITLQNLKRVLSVLCIVTVLAACHSEKPPGIYIATSQLALRQSPSGQGKFLSDIMVGEQVTMLDSTFTDTELKREYSKVELSDKKQGWALTNGLLPIAKLGVIMNYLTLYKRPQIATQLPEESNIYQLILFDTTQIIDNFVPITSMYGTPIGWIQKESLTNNVSTQTNDIITILHLVSQKLIKYGKAVEITDVNKVMNLQQELSQKGVTSEIINYWLSSNTEGYDENENLPDRTEDTAYIEEN